MVNALEIGEIDGMVWFRAGGLGDEDPAVRIVLPADLSAQICGSLAEASLDAEEQYWPVIGQLTRSIDTTDPGAVARHVHGWLADQEWLQVAERVPNRGPLRVIAYAGHVGFLVAPPFADQAAILVLDPLQLRRMETGLQALIARARQAEAAAGGQASARMSTRMARALASLTARPWRESARFCKPTRAEAMAEITARHAEFLARPSYRRPDRGSR